MSNPNQVGVMDGWSDDSLRLLVDEGRRQVDAQASRFQEVQARAQVLLTVALVALGFVTGLLPHISNAQSIQRAASSVLWAVAVFALVLAVAIGGGVVAVRADLSPAMSMGPP
jgi:hypothetical protein